MKKLDDYSSGEGGSGHATPRVKAVGRVRIQTPDGENTVARWGQSPELNERVAILHRDCHQRIHKLGTEGAFAISNKGLDIMTSLGVRRLFFKEPDTGDVYEYKIEDFTEWGERVPDNICEYPKADPQTWVDRADPLNHYPDAVSEVEIND